MSARPRIQLKPTRGQRYMELLSMTLAIGSLLYVVYNYTALPDTIATHFGASGEPDGFGSKETIWILPIMNVVTVMGLWYISRKPHLLNYVTEPTADNAERLYNSGAQTIRVVNLVTSILLAYLSYQSVRVALGYAEGLEPMIMWPLLGILLLYAIIQAIRGYRMK